MLKFFRSIKEFLFPINIYSKKFWVKVHREYNSSYFDSPFICHKSPTFESAWDKKPDEIRILAREFLTWCKGDLLFCEAIVLNNGVLFYTDKRDIKKLRKAFIRWCIKRFS